MIFTIIVLITFLCWLSSIILIKGLRAGYFKLMPWYLGLTTLVELTGYIVYFKLHYPNNYWVFNAFLPLEVLFLSWIFYHLLSNYFYCKTLIIVGSLGFLLIYLFESFNSAFLAMSMKAKDFGSVYLIILCLIYYYFLQKDNNYVNLKWHADFWIVTGCFFFYFSSIGCDFFFDYLRSINLGTTKPVRYLIFIVLNFIMYGCWSFSFLCRYKQKI